MLDIPSAAEAGFPQIAERMTATGQIVTPGSPAEFTAAIEEQAAALATHAKVLGAKK